MIDNDRRFLLIFATLCATAVALTGCFSPSTDEQEERALDVATEALNLAVTRGADADALLAQAGLPANAPLDARARAIEVQNHLANGYFKLNRVIETTVNRDGQTVDWIDPRDLDPKFDTRKPPAPNMRNPSGDDNTSTVTPKGLAEYQDDPGMHGRAGTAAVIRPNLSYYTSGESKQPNLAAFLASIRKPQLSTTLRLYAGYTSVSATAVNTGSQGWVNYFEIAGVPDAEMSLVQTLVSSCETNPNPPYPGAFMESIEWGIQKSKANYGDTKLHHFTYFNTNGYTATGPLKGGYDQRQTGFVPYPGAPFAPGAVVGGSRSVVGGAQVERRLRIVLSGNAWWIQDWVSSTSNTWLGYYPIGTASPNINFKFIKTGACTTAWYAEVSDATPTTWNTADMAAGLFVSNGFGKVGYMRNAIEERGSSSVWFSTSAGAMFGDPKCYNKTGVSSGTGNWARYFYYGGPGYTTGATGTCK